MAVADIYTRLIYLFGTEQQQRRRIFSVICREKLMNTFPLGENKQTVLSGSTSEGLDYPRSDYDSMIVHSEPDMIVQTYSEDALQYNAPLMIPSYTSPGHCLLWIPNVRRHHYGRFCFNGCLSSFAWKTIFRDYNNCLNGPCLYSVVLGMEYDYAHCLLLPKWPDIAEEWIHRDRPYGWPSHSVVQQIVNNGCHVVPKGDPASLRADFQWLVSFAKAERTLVHTFNHAQFLIYNVLKLVCKRIINVEEPHCISSYYIKTVLFYCIEKTERSMWDIERLDICYSKCLSLLYDFIQEMSCPNYFVKENNIFKRKVGPYNRPRLLSLLVWLLQQGIAGALYHTEEFSILYLPITVTMKESKHDLEILGGYVFLILILDIRKIIHRLNNLSPYNTSAYEMTMRTIIDIANVLLTSEEARGFTLLLLRFCSTYMAGKLDSEFQNIVLKNKPAYQLRKIIQKFYEHGTEYDISLGRLRYATHLYMLNDVDKCLALIQEALSAKAPYVLTEDCSFDDDLLAKYEQAVCGRNLTIAEKSRLGFARVIEFLPQEYSIIPAPVSILMCYGERVGCNEPVAINPVVYAYFLQGLCLIRLQLNPRETINMLKNTLQNNNFTYMAMAVYSELSYGYSLLGWLEMLQCRFRDAARYFAKSFVLREVLNRPIWFLETGGVNFSHLNMGIVCNRKIGAVKTRKPRVC